jgi:beta-phosphoglucomutase
VFATLFDFDGVLVDSEPVHLAAFNDVLAGMNMKLDAKEYAERYLSLDDAGVFRELLSRARITLDEEQVRALVAAKAPRFMARFEAGFKVFPGARELLVRRAARGPVGIVSGALEAEVELGLSKMGARDAVAFIIAADQTTASKPDPAPYRAAMAALTRVGHPGGVVAVEDSLGGIASATGAGLRCVAVSHTYGRQELERAGAAAVVASLDAMDDALLEAP